MLKINDVCGVWRLKEILSKFWHARDSFSDGEIAVCQVRIGIISTSDARSKNPRAASGAKASRSIAVALEHTPGSDAPPEVVASGQGELAEKILQLAFANDVKVREDSDLAELLSALEVGSEIPLEAFAAVAEILVYLYKANGEEPPQSIAAAWNLEDGF